jgi:hypothetical protein
VDGTAAGRPHGDPGNPNGSHCASGLGFMHFLCSRWVWSISDPKVRETIGIDIFSVAIQSAEMARLGYTARCSPAGRFR